MMEKEIKLANRWRRFLANLLDMLFFFTILGGVANLILAIRKETTLGYLIAGIEYQDADGGKLNGRKKRLRILTNYPVYTTAMLFCGFVCLGIVIGIGEDTSRGNFMEITFGILLAPGLIYRQLLGIWNLVEIFGETPNWVEKKLGTRRIQNGKGKIGRVFGLLLLIIGLILLIRGLSSNKETRQGARYANGLVQGTEQYGPIFTNYESCKNWALSKLINKQNYSYCMSECYDALADGSPRCKKVVRSRAPIPGVSEVFEGVDPDFYEQIDKRIYNSDSDYGNSTAYEPLYNTPIDTQTTNTVRNNTENTVCVEPQNPYDEYNEEGHYAGFERAERTGGYCDGNSVSFNEGCTEYYQQEEIYEQCLNNK